MLNGLSLYTEAIEMLLKAVGKEPVHWGAWKELASICKNRETVSCPACGTKLLFYTAQVLDIIFH